MTASWEKRPLSSSSRPSTLPFAVPGRFRRCPSGISSGPHVSTWSTNSERGRVLRLDRPSTMFGEHTEQIFPRTKPTRGRLALLRVDAMHRTRGLERHVMPLVYAREGRSRSAGTFVRHPLSPGFVVLVQHGFAADLARNVDRHVPVVLQRLHQNSAACIRCERVDACDRSASPIDRGAACARWHCAASSPPSACTGRTAVRRAPGNPRRILRSGDRVAEGELREIRLSQWSSPLRVPGPPPTVGRHAREAPSERLAAEALHEQPQSKNDLVLGAGHGSSPRPMVMLTSEDFFTDRAFAASSRAGYGEPIL